MDLPRFEVLFEDAAVARGDDLEQVYGGAGLRLPEPGVVANFVSTVDGVVSLGGTDGGAAVSGGKPADRLLMAMLRALSDVVLIGAGTLRQDPRHQWTPAGILPDAAAPLQALRVHALGERPHVLAVVTATGHLPLQHPALSAPEAGVIVLSTATGAQRLAGSGLQVVTVTDDDALGGAAIVAALQQRGLRRVLCEGGPLLFATLLADQLVDELFLTVAPQLAGDAAGTLRLVNGVPLPANWQQWMSLRSVRRADSHLFLRYAL